MAPLPDALERREILYGKPKKSPDFEAVGRDYEAAGRRSDACEAYARISDEAKRKASLERLKSLAIEAGDQFLLNQLASNLKVGENLEVSVDEWRQCMEAARKQGKLRYALKVAERIEDADVVAELKKELGMDLPPPPEPIDAALTGGAEATPATAEPEPEPDSDSASDSKSEPDSDSDS